MKWIRALWRFFYFALSTIFHIAGFYALLATGKDRQSAGQIFRRRWLSHVPHHLGLRTIRKGQPHRDTCLFVGNHISYLDPFMLLMHADAHVVAKAEVLRWPIVGLAGELIGTIYVNRDQKESRHQAVNSIQQALKEGISVIVFPEGTTTQGRQTLPFRPRSFQAAADAGVPVQPVALTYADPRVAFIGNHTFVPHFFKLFSRKTIFCKIAFGPLLTGEGAQEEARAWIDQQLTPYTPAEVA